MKKPVDLIFLWHMHQPDYRDYATGDFVLPWTYLHAIKDYTDMAYHLERHPKVRAVINFVPILLDQIEDYVDQFATGKLRDPLLRLLAHPNPEQFTEAERALTLEACFRSNEAKMIAPYPAYKRLQTLFLSLQNEADSTLSYLSGQYMADLLTWYHLAWFGEGVRREEPVLLALMKKGSGFTYADRQQILALIGQCLKGVIPRYRQLEERGQIEISATPHFHPLAPLLIDFASAKQAMPDAPMPESACYPDGRARVAAHIAQAKNCHASRFGKAPNGFWPAEGAISDETLAVMAEEGCRWIASGQGVLANSLRRAHQDTASKHHYLYRPYHYTHGDAKLNCFFRDDQLSDLIGFEYSHWHGQDAARHFVEQIDQVGRHAPHSETPVVSIILDGENAWEYYPYNGFYFLDELYGLLETHANIHTHTCSDYLRLNNLRTDATKPHTLPPLVAGSWVYGNFATWIGSKDKNRAWDLLCAAKTCFDAVIAGGELTAAEEVAAEQQLCSCESSDWFWWFGDDNPSQSVQSFDRLYRHDLRELYRLLKLVPPAELDSPISRGGGYAEAGGAMRRGSE
jgi:alpha-amylase/alpha-mannosidase (GH57 family)